jgi:hypothetical protein
MGCGSSSLKGDKPEGLSGDDPQPVVRKVKTNFSTVDYDQDNGDTKRRMTEYAPHEEIGAIPEASGGPSAATTRPSAQADIGPSGERVELEPYKTLSSPTTDLNPTYPHEKAGGARSHDQEHDAALTDPMSRPKSAKSGDGGVDPTSSQAKDQFAQENDPVRSGSAASSGEVKTGRKTSIADKIFGKRDRKDISDEEMKKVSTSRPKSANIIVFAFRDC